MSVSINHDDDDDPTAFVRRFSLQADHHQQLFFSCHNSAHWKGSPRSLPNNANPNGIIVKNTANCWLVKWFDKFGPLRPIELASDHPRNLDQTAEFTFSKEARPFLFEIVKNYLTLPIWVIWSTNACSRVYPRDVYHGDTLDRLVTAIATYVSYCQNRYQASNDHFLPGDVASRSDWAIFKSFWQQMLLQIYGKLIGLFWKEPLLK